MRWLKKGAVVWSPQILETYFRADPKSMRAAGNSDIRAVEVPKRNHGSLMTKINEADDRIGGLTLRFIKGRNGSASR